MVGRVVNSAALRGRSMLVVDAPGIGEHVGCCGGARLPCMLYATI
jgi:hypothetical protein